jgi:hypothetical protein
MREAEDNCRVPEEISSPAAAECSTLERFDQAVRHAGHLGDVDRGPAHRATVYVLRTVGEAQSLGRNRAEVGFYRARLGGPLAVVPLDDSRSDTFNQAVLFHEYSHHLLFGSYSSVWPAWLSDGLAEFYATAKLQDDGGVRIGLPPSYRANSLLATQEIATGSHVETRIQELTLKQLLSISHREGSTSVRLHARAWLLVHYLNFEPSRREQLTRYLAELERGIGSVEAGTTAFGKSGTLDGQLDAYLKRNRFEFLSVPASEIKMSAIDLRPLSAGEEEVFRYRIRTKVHAGDVDTKEAQNVASAVRAIASRFPADAVVQVTLAQAELGAGNHAAAEAAADRAIAIDPTLIEAHICKGTAQMAIAKASPSAAHPAAWIETRKTLIAANRLDPDHPQPLTLFYQTFSASHETPTANAIAGLHMARKLAPQVAELHLMAGYQHLTEGQVEEARKALLRYAIGPHDAENRDDVLAVVQTLDREGTAAALATFVARNLKSW